MSQQVGLAAQLRGGPATQGKSAAQAVRRHPERQEGLLQERPKHLRPRRGARMRRRYALRRAAHGGPQRSLLLGRQNRVAGHTSTSVHALRAAQRAQRVQRHDARLPVPPLARQARLCHELQQAAVLRLPSRHPLRARQLRARRRHRLKHRLRQLLRHLHLLQRRGAQQPRRRLQEERPHRAQRLRGAALPQAARRRRRRREAGRCWAAERRHRRRQRCAGVEARKAYCGFSLRGEEAVARGICV
mmetsp:Transcript_3345/g.8447  ORF Transcript_3345/g.8447 Transcript_3345/m.8447 type:complete len:245 (+) Transcript_3345:399-1133(+)